MYVDLIRYFKYNCFKGIFGLSEVITLVDWLTVHLTLLSEDSPRLLYMGTVYILLILYYLIMLLNKIPNFVCLTRLNILSSYWNTAHGSVRVMLIISLVRWDAEIHKVAWAMSVSALMISNVPLKQQTSQLKTRRKVSLNWRNRWSRKH